MPAPIIPFKAGLVLLLGIVSAPVIKPLLEKTLKATVKVGIKAKQAAADVKSDLKVYTAEAIQEKYASAD
jgi:hypothetical protein